MADRTIRMILKAEVADFKRQMAEAAASMDKIPANASKTETALGSMVQSARYNREAWTTAGTAIAGFGVAILAVGAAAVKTGVSYNTLQQTSRAAMTTLLGSAQAANAQMDKLDDFARNSPFAKQVFITAQQQLLGFGVAANKVLPALDAIQNAVAAMGGSNDQIAAIADILARIKSEGRLSGDALQRLGYYGVDAAELIGSQMGMTSAQIRDMASKPGGIPVDQVWDPLVNGMMEKFGGAAANVKNTFAGAIDRVKAAWRDFSGMIAEPLVGAEGGGAFVGLLNGAADVLRWFQALPEPIRNVSLGVVGLTGVASVLTGGFLVMAPRILDTVDALKTMHLWTKNVAIAGGAFAALGLAAVLLGIADALQTASVSSEELKNRLTALEGSATGVAALFSDIGQGWADNLSTLNFDVGAASADDFRASLDLINDYSIQPDMGPIGDFSKMMSDIAGRDGGLRQFGIRVRQIGDELGSLAASDLPSATEQFNSLVDAAGGGKEVVAQLVNQMPAYRDALYAAATAQGVTLDETTLLAAATGELALGTGAAGVAQNDLAADYDTTTEAIGLQLPTLEDLISLQAEAAGIVLSERDAQRAFQAAIDDATAALETNGQTLDITTAAGRANQDALDGIAKSGEDVQVSMQAAGATQAELVAAMQVSRDAFVNMAIAEGMGADEANRLADQMGLIPAKVASAVSVDISGAVRDVEAIKAILRSIPDVVITSQMRADNPYYGGGLHGATGGILPGAPSSKDNMFIHAASGEFLVNAWATARNRSTLEAINAGLPGYAAGGLVQPAYAPWAMAGTGTASAPAAVRGGVDVHDFTITAADPTAAVRAFQSEMSWGLVGVPS